MHETLQNQHLISFHKWTDKADARKTYDDYLMARPDQHEL
jgi:hypothetical protein